MRALLTTVVQSVTPVGQVAAPLDSFIEADVMKMKFVKVPLQPIVAQSNAYSEPHSVLSSTIAELRAQSQSRRCCAEISALLVCLRCGLSDAPCLWEVVSLMEVARDGEVPLQRPRR